MFTKILVFFITTPVPEPYSNPISDHVSDLFQDWDINPIYPTRKVNNDPVIGPASDPVFDFFPDPFTKFIFIHF